MDHLEFAADPVPVVAAGEPDDEVGLLGHVLGCRRVLRLLAAAVLALTALSVGVAASGTQASASDGVTGHMWDDGPIG